jgi:hypothetical protein
MSFELRDAGREPATRSFAFIGSKLIGMSGFRNSDIPKLPLVELPP